MFYITPDMFSEGCITDPVKPVNLDESFSFNPETGGVCIIFYKDEKSCVIWEYETEQQSDKVFEEIVDMVRRMTTVSYGGII